MINMIPIFRMLAINYAKTIHSLTQSGTEVHVYPPPPPHYSNMQISKVIGINYTLFIFIILVGNTCLETLKVIRARINMH